MQTAYLRHALELAMIFPASLFCLVPMRGTFRISLPKLVFYVTLTEAAIIFAGAWICLYFPKLPLLFLSVLICFPLLVLVSDLSIPKLLFCTLNAILFCVFCNIYTLFLMARYELDGLSTFTPRSSLVSILLTLFVFLITSPVLSRMIPQLFSMKRLNGIWLIVSAFLTALSIFLLWMAPKDLNLVFEGRIRLLCLIYIPAALIIIWLQYCMLWWVAQRLEESAKLQQEVTLLRMQTKRYEEFGRHLNELRVLRHDYRQHIRVLSELGREGKTDDLLRYLDELDHSPALTAPARYCANLAVDALASHYTALAAEQSSIIDWTLELPETLSGRETDFCAIIGNLTENALHAVETLPEEQRRVQVVCRMLSEQMLGISVENPYTGRIRRDAEGLPYRKGSLGLRSVSAMVNQYHGSMDISTNNGIFAVHILLYI